MINKVGREIPEEILEMTGKEVFQGIYYKDGIEFNKQGPVTKVVMNHDTSKLVGSIHEALVKCGAHNGMTLGFHHHFRDGDLIVNMVSMKYIKWELKMLQSVPALWERRMMRLFHILKMGRLQIFSPLVSEERLVKRFPMAS